MPLIRMVLGLAVLAGILAFTGPVNAQTTLAEFLPALNAGEIFPGADRLGPPEGSPASAPAYAGDRLLGWVALNTDWGAATGYSGKPIRVAVAVDTGGKIVGAKLLKHSEPIVLVGIPERRIVEFIQGYVGYDVLAHRTDSKPPVDIIAGATVTVVVIGDSITRTAAKVVRAHQGSATQVPPGQAPPGAAARALDLSQAGTRSWAELVGDGSVRRLRLSVADVNAAFAKDERAAARPEPGEPDDTFIDLYAAPVSVPVIGRSLLGEEGYARLPKERPALLLMAEGLYSFRGSGYVRGGLFDRFEVIQGESSIRFRDRDYERLGDVAAADAPAFAEIGLFVVPEGQAFDLAAPWTLQLLVSRSVGALEKSFLTFQLPYELPQRYLAPPPPQALAAAAPAPAASEAESPGESRDRLWRQMWQAKLAAVGVLTAALALLTAAFFFQDWLVRRPRVLKWFRLGFLAFTLAALGWVWNAQLSVVNVLALFNALATDFSWDYFLMDPLIFILWSATAAALVFWARGAFCGWLCPFGALQEFANLAGKRLKLPQVTVPWGLHERMWPLKYILFLGLFGVSFYSLATAEHLAEVEPFKTAIILKFLRDWPFVLYAAALVVGSLFIERFFCRYLCPLGAGLAIPARMRTFDWLKRHRECGSPCQRCANECPVQSIHPDGRINPNECIYCMHCQELYWDEHRCPHMIQVRLRRERRDAMSPPPRPSQAAGPPPDQAAPQPGGT
ncbi:MAG: NosR/NirI family protein [Magnetospirillum sp.]|nr:NosR/NirI family protein [Magnetospirillum sp.]